MSRNSEKQIEFNKRRMSSISVFYVLKLFLSKQEMGSIFTEQDIWDFYDSDKEYSEVLNSKKTKKSEYLRQLIQMFIKAGYITFIAKDVDKDKFIKTIPVKDRLIRKDKEIDMFITQVDLAIEGSKI